MNLRIMKIVIAASIAAWGLLDGVGNLIVYDVWVKVVADVMMLENNLYDGEISPRAITNPIMHHIGYAFIYITKIIAGAYCAIGTYNLWKARKASAEIFDFAKTKFYIGSGVAMFLLIFGFVVMKGSFFNTGLMPSDFTMKVFDFVTVYMVSIGFGLLYVSIPEPSEP